MGLTVQFAVDKEESERKRFVKLSHSLRTLLLFAAAALGVALSCFNTVTSLAPLFFPRIAIALRPLFNRGEQEEQKQ